MAAGHRSAIWYGGGCSGIKRLTIVQVEMTSLEEIVPIGRFPPKARGRRKPTRECRDSVRSERRGVSRFSVSLSGCATACPLWDKQCPPARAIIGPSQRQEHCFCEDSEAVAHLPFQRYSLRENDPNVTGIGRKPEVEVQHVGLTPRRSPQSASPSHCNFHLFWLDRSAHSSNRSFLEKCGTDRSSLNS